MGGEDDDATEELRSGPLESIGEVRHYLKYDLASELEGHERVQRDAMNEATYTAIVWEAVQRRIGPRFRVELDRCVPGTNLRADVLLYRDRATGVIAIEVKLKAQNKSLASDFQKLANYIAQGRSRINCGVLLYFSSRPADDALDDAHRRLRERNVTLARKLAIVHVTVPRKRIDWHPPEG